MMKIRNNIFICLLAIIVTLQTSPAMAGKSSAVLNGRSYHFNSTYDWNEDNFGLGLEHEFESESAWRTTIMANGFRDSTDNMTYMAGAGLHRQLFSTDRMSGFYVYAGLNAFIMAREDVENSKPFPGILPSVSIGNEKIGFNLTYLPRQAVEVTTQAEIVDPTISGILFIQFKVSLDQLLP
jgi:hypothetical protein